MKTWPVSRIGGIPYHYQPEHKLSIKFSLLSQEIPSLPGVYTEKVRYANFMEHIRKDSLILHFLMNLISQLILLFDEGSVPLKNGKENRQNLLKIQPPPIVTKTE